MLATIMAPELDAQHLLIEIGDEADFAESHFRYCTQKYLLRWVASRRPVCTSGGEVRY